jgi:hypothetical protein
LQHQAKLALEVPKRELREVGAALDAEAAQASAEDKQLRELWLTGGGAGAPGF